LPPDPGRRRADGYFEVDKLATPMTDEEDDVKGLKSQREGFNSIS
jgi:hypothetical protein